MIVALHIVSSKRHDDFLWEARDLQSAGKTRQAQAKLREAEAIQQQLTALEDEYRPPSGHKRERSYANY